MDAALIRDSPTGQQHGWAAIKWKKRNSTVRYEESDLKISNTIYIGIWYISSHLVDNNWGKNIQ